ncbi:MAG: transposase, partial [Chitinispirillia bacterium]|nr:transposase [Chitinispirillia bacterium]
QRVRDEYVYRVMAIADEKARRAYYRDKAKEDIKKAKEESKAEGKAEGMAEGMAEGVAQGKAEGLAKGMTEGAAKERQKNANAMIAEGIPPETIARITGLSVDKIRKL